jgi:hypothetical protein
MGAVRNVFREGVRPQNFLVRKLRNVCFIVNFSTKKLLGSFEKFGFYGFVLR